MDKSLTLPKVSIVIATYRREIELHKALRSINTQTYTNMEVLLIDDNAQIEWNQKVEKIIESIDFKKNIEFVYIQNDKNEGSAQTRNIGIENASGEYITFLDDDDMYLPNKVENQILHMLNEKSDFSLTDLYLYNEEGRLIEKRIRNYIKDTKSDNLLKYHLMNHMTGTDVMMFKKQYLSIIGMFPKKNIGDEFYLMQKAIEYGGTFSYLPRCDVQATVHTKTNSLSSGDSKIFGEKELFEYKKTHFNKLNKKEIKYIEMRHYAVLAYAEYRRNNLFMTAKYLLTSLKKSPIGIMTLIGILKVR